MVREWGECRQEEGLRNHVDLVQLLDIVNMEAGTAVGGGVGHHSGRAGGNVDRCCCHAPRAALGCLWMYVIRVVLRPLSLSPELRNPLRSSAALDESV